jgi:hypothetical protein
MILNLETLSLEAWNTVLDLSVEAIAHRDGVFIYEGKQYKAYRDAKGQLEVKRFSPVKDRMDRWTQAQKDSFRLLVDTAKNSAESTDRQFEFDGIAISVELLADGKAILHTRRGTAPWRISPSPTTLPPTTN